MPQSCRIALILFFVSIGGCALPPTNVEKPLSELPKPRVDESVVLEVGFARVPRHDPEWFDKLWAELDEQHFSADHRQRLLANGLRCGLAGEQIPEILRVALQRDESIPIADPNSVTAQSAIRRLHLRPSSRSELITSAENRSLTVLIDDGQSINGHQFETAQVLFAIQTKRAKSGRAEVELTPEVQFGQTKQRYVGQDGAFVLQAKRDNRVFGDLKIEDVLVPGQTLVITCDGPDKSLGGNAFQSEDGDTQKLLLVRLAHGQEDDLFDQNSLLDSI